MDAALLPEVRLHPPQRLLHVLPRQIGGELTGDPHRFTLNGKKKSQLVMPDIDFFLTHISYPRYCLIPISTNPVVELADYG